VFFVFLVVGLGVCRFAFFTSALSRAHGRRFVSPFLGGGGLPSALLVLLTVVRCFVVIVCFPPLACVLGVLGVRFLPIVGRIEFVLRSVSALACVVVLAVGIRICCLCRSLFVALL
jgi:hypothetical protein